MSMLKPKTCPHDDCGKTFTKFVKKQGILFCPHCQKSVLIDDTEKQNLSFFEFTWQTLIENRFIIYILLFLLPFFLMLFLDSVKFSDTVMFLYFIPVLVFLGVIIWNNIESDKNKSPVGGQVFWDSYKFNDKKLLKGVDKLSVINDIHNLAPISENISDLAYKAGRKNVSCSYCQSQALIYPVGIQVKNATHIAGDYYQMPTVVNHTWQEREYFCLNCHSISTLNQKILKFRQYSLYLQFLFYIFAFLPLYTKNLRLIVFAVLVITLIVLNCIFDYKKYHLPLWENPKTEKL